MTCPFVVSSNRRNRRGVSVCECLSVTSESLLHDRVESYDISNDLSEQIPLFQSHTCLMRHFLYAVDTAVNQCILLNIVLSMIEQDRAGEPIN